MDYADYLDGNLNDFQKRLKKKQKKLPGGNLAPIKPSGGSNNYSDAIRRRLSSPDNVKRAQDIVRTASGSRTPTSGNRVSQNGSVAWKKLK